CEGETGAEEGASCGSMACSGKGACAGGAIVGRAARVALPWVKARAVHAACSYAWAARPGLEWATPQQPSKGPAMRLDIYRRPEPEGRFSYLAVPEGKPIPQEAINTDWE